MLKLIYKDLIRKSECEFCSPVILIGAFFIPEKINKHFNARVHFVSPVHFSHPDPMKFLGVQGTFYKKPPA